MRHYALDTCMSSFDFKACSITISIRLTFYWYLWHTLYRSWWWKKGYIDSMSLLCTYYPTSYEPLQSRFPGYTAKRRRRSTPICKIYQRSILYGSGKIHCIFMHTCISSFTVNGSGIFRIVFDPRLFDGYLFDRTCGHHWSWCRRLSNTCREIYAR